MLIPCYRFCPPKSCSGSGKRGHRNFSFSPSAIEIDQCVARCCTFLRGRRDRLHDRSDCCAPLRTVAPHTPMLTQLGRARCGIVRHRRCPNPRMPRSTPSAYSQRTNRVTTLVTGSTIPGQAQAVSESLQKYRHRESGRSRQFGSARRRTTLALRVLRQDI